MLKDEILLKQYESYFNDKDKIKKFMDRNKDFRVPAYYDNIFKLLFNDKDFTSIFLSHFIGLDAGEIKKTMLYKNVEGEYINNKHKGYIADLIIELDNYVILLECNKEKRSAIINKNLHTFRGMCYNTVVKGASEKIENYKHCILISLDNYDSFKQNKIQTKGKYLDVESKIELINNETIYFINLDLVRRKMYNTIDKTKLNAYEKALMLIVVSPRSLAKEIVKGDKIMESVNAKLDNYTFDIDNLMMSAQMVLENGLRHEFRREGIKEGIKKGTKENKINVAKNMIRRTNLDDKAISECTDLSIDYITKLRLEYNNKTLE